MTDGPIKLAERSGQMQTNTVEQMLLDALELVRANPNAFTKGHIILREETEPGFVDETDFTVHECRAGFRDEFDVIGYLTHTAFRRSQAMALNVVKEYD